MSQEEFLEIAEATCGHAGLYTPTGSFYEGVSFLEGYALGADVGEANYHSAFTPFLKWLTARSGIENGILSWTDFRGQFESDAEAFANLLRLYKEYISASQN